MSRISHHDASVRKDRHCVGATEFARPFALAPEFVAEAAPDVNDDRCLRHSFVEDMESASAVEGHGAHTASRTVPNPHPSHRSDPVDLLEVGWENQGAVRRRTG